MPLVRDLMTKGVLTIIPSQTMFEAAKIMDRKNIGALVVSKDDKILGIITERDILTKIVAKGRDPSKTLVEEVMSKPVITVDYTATLKEAAYLMVENRIRRLPVVKNGNLFGIITSTDITYSILGAIARRQQAVVAQS